MGSGYARPPITEAVVEFRMAGSLDIQTLQRLARDFAANYPLEEQINEIYIHVGDSPPKDAPLPTFKRLSYDATEILLLKESSLGVAQLAPYVGWEAFMIRVRRDWEIWRKRTDYRQLSRIGVRFINRIDVPRMDKDSMVSPGDYLKALPSLPEELQEAEAFQMNLLSRLEHLKSDLTLNVATAVSPLLRHTSFLLDIDIGRIWTCPGRRTISSNCLILYGTRKTEYLRPALHRRHGSYSNEYQHENRRVRESTERRGYYVRSR